MSEHIGSGFVSFDFLTDGKDIVITLEGEEPVLISPDEPLRRAPAEPDVRLGRAAELGRAYVLRDASLTTPSAYRGTRSIGFLKSEIDRARQRRADARASLRPH